MSGTSRKRGLHVDGNTLRELRHARRWSQEEAACRSGLSDKLIRKAERSGLIDANSVAALATLYSTAEASVRPADLIIAPSPDITSSGSDGSALLGRWLTEIWGERSLDAIDRIAAPELVFHCELGTLVSLAAVRQRMADLRRSFGGIRLSVERIAQTKLTVMCRWRLTMTHIGDWRGIEPTGKRVETLVITTARFQADRLVECWEFWEPGPVYRELLRRVNDPNYLF